MTERHRDDELIVTARMRYAAAIGAAQRGNPALAQRELAELYAQRATFPRQLALMVQINYGITLLASQLYPSGISVLRQVREEYPPLPAENGYDPVHIAHELSSGYLNTGQLDLATQEIEYAAELCRKAGRPDPYVVLLQGNLRRIGPHPRSAAECFHQALQLFAEARDGESLGIVTEQLARMHLSLGEMGTTHHWAFLCEALYQKYAPQHLPTIRALRNENNLGNPTGTPPAEALVLNEFLAPSPARHQHDRISIYDIDLFEFLTQCMLPPCPIHFRKELRDRMPADGVDVDMRGFAGMVAADLQIDPGGMPFVEVFRALRSPQVFGVDETALPDTSNLPAGPLTFASKGGATVTLHWETQFNWISSLSTTLTGLELFYVNGFLHLAKLHRQVTEDAKNNGIDISHSLRFSPMFGRTLPRRIQQRYFEAGEHRTGLTAGVPLLVEDLCAPLLSDRKLNRIALEKMDYKPEEAIELAEGDLLGLPLKQIEPVMPAMASGQFGSLPFNETNAANPPAPIFYETPNDVRLQYRLGAMVDAHYQSAFMARPVRDFAFYGNDNGLMRDHFSALHAAFPPEDYVRAKHYAIPVIAARSFSDLQAIAQAVPIHNDTGLFFRGQTQPYYLNRPRAAMKILYGREAVIEPSLPGAAPRRGYDYNRVHALLQLCVQDEIYRSAAEHGRNLTDIHEKWATLARFQAADWDAAVTALAQHYGIPTNGLDITNSLDVALWFATNRFVCHANGTNDYVPLSASDWPDDPWKWPCIYFVQPVTNSLRHSVKMIRELDDLGLEAVRPHRQHAALFMGADTIHRNRLAEALVCVVRLAPGTWETKSTFRSLFPPEDEDPAYRMFLRLRSQFANSAFAPFFNEVCRFHGPS